MNKNIIYIAIAVLVGLLGGWLIFEGSSEESMTDTHDHSAEVEGQMWTCSMHPQIMQPEPGDCPICGMNLIPAETGTDCLAVNEIKMTKNAMALADIQTSIVGNASEDDENRISLSGKIEMNEEENAVQASYFDGRIERLNVNFEGQEIRKGQLLATIYAPNLIAAQQELITAVSLKESQPSLYKAVRNKLKLWKLSENQINTIEESGKVKENFPIYATVSGTVIQVMAAEGDYVKQGQPIAKVSNLNSVWAEFDAYENQISELKKGQKIKVTTNAYPNKEFDATISFIDPVLNTQTRTVTVRANLRNSDGLLKPGMFVTGKVEGTIENEKSTLTIPASAVLWTGERSLVYLKTNPNEPVFEMREIVLGNRIGDTYTVTSGLENGDEIVTNGTFTIDAAAQLQGKKSMMNQKSVGKSTSSGGTNMITYAEDIQLPAKAMRTFKQSLNSYLNMKDALVAGDAPTVATNATAMLKYLNKISGNDLGEREQGLLAKIKQMLSAIAENDLLENQRSHFVILNENLVPIMMHMDSASTTVYVQKCPMANNDQGAVWLSGEREIRNPYYGDAMLSCGSVIDSIN
jgi:Cu(I)/Ag(I) efflux system membrane fusion protein